ncbi:hypothetical protein HPB47_008357 [Ixodes persulcatus]|uniref:Uncharacterized protein n=1 Tax=Ixodes persulcatus TaxID=34615 RepID=A0AC60P5A2_IXOPE|nr:hypothetical protein HPB47_008357 [Ixodes persulcatus]
MRIVTGLPRFTRVDELERIAQMNTIQEIAEEQRISQALRLSRTPQGRTILTLSGRAHLIEGPFMPTPPPPWETEAVTVAKPIPKNQGNDSPGRRVTQASNHMAEVRGLGGHIEVFYTDASCSETGRTAISWYSPTKQDMQQEITENTKSTCSAELRAILMAAQAAILKRANITETCIYTRHSASCFIQTLVREVKDDQTITVAWLPGHEGIPGNERANGAARAELQATQPSQGPVPPLSPRKVPEDTADFDLSEVKREERAARKACLTTLLPPNPHRIPSSFPRRERVALNRLQTKTVLTPDWLSRIYHPTDPDDVGPDPNCEHCGVPATCSHLVWDCAESAPEREAATRSLPYHIRPCSYTEWTKPTTAILNEQKLIYTSLIDFLRSSGIAEKEKVAVHQLLMNLKQTEKHRQLRRQVRAISRNAKVLPTPLPKPQQQRVERQVAYDKVEGEVSRWDPVVKKNRLAEQICFPLQQPDMRMVPAEQFVKKFQPKTSLEAEINKLLASSENVLHDDKELTPAEEKALQAMSLDEARERRQELMKMRALLSYQEMKARRQNKIKSKKYHRIMKKERLKKQMKEFEELKESNPELAIEKLRELEKQRVLVN